MSLTLSAVSIMSLFSSHSSCLQITIAIRERLSTAHTVLSLQTAGKTSPDNPSCEGTTVHSQHRHHRRQQARHHQTTPAVRVQQSTASMVITADNRQDVTRQPQLWGYNSPLPAPSSSQTTGKTLLDNPSCQRVTFHCTHSHPCGQQASHHQTAPSARHSCRSRQTGKTSPDNLSCQRVTLHCQCSCPCGQAKHHQTALSARQWLSAFDSHHSRRSKTLKKANCKEMTVHAPLSHRSRQTGKTSQDTETAPTSREQLQCHSSHQSGCWKRTSLATSSVCINIKSLSAWMYFRTLLLWDLFSLY